MKGKIVNLCIGGMNILLGILFLVFTLYVPQDKTLLTIQESLVVNYILKGIYVVILAIFIINFIQFINYRRTYGFNTAYFLSMLSFIFIFINQPIVSLIPIIGGIMISFKTLKENLVEIDSTTAISIIILIIAVTVVIMGLSLVYDNIGQSIKNSENKNETSYKEDYFRYIVELRNR